MTTEDLANVIFPHISKTVEDIEKMYPKRNLKDGAEVTRFAPSPTGYMHIGNFMMALIDYIIAKNTDGVFYLRNEDTDKAREVENAVNLIMDTLFHVHDGWVKDNVKKFNAREKKHQHMPSELIGWNEAKADLLFVRPIFEAAGIEVNEEELEQSTL